MAGTDAPPARALTRRADALRAASRGPLLAGWLRRTRTSGHADRWVLRGSLVTAALCRDARAPADVDYLLGPSADGFDADALAAELRAIAALPDDATTMTVTATEVIWAETSSPGVRAHVTATAGALVDDFQIDTAVGDPMIVPPRSIELAGVGPVLACAGETMFGWKLHGLCEHGRGRWRAKDLYDLDLLWRQADLDLDATRAAVALAFSSRGLALTALDDLRTRADWGGSRGGVRKWRALREAQLLADDLTATRDRVVAALDVLLGPTLAATC